MTCFYSPIKAKSFKIKVYELPEGKRASKGKPIINFISLSSGEKVTSILVLPKKLNKEEASLVLITKNGMIKKVSASHFEDVRRSGILAVRLQKGDELRWAHLVFKGDHLILATSHGQAIRFKESDVRTMGRTAGGVKAMRLKKRRRTYRLGHNRRERQRFVAFDDEQKRLRQKNRP